MFRMCAFFVGLMLTAAAGLWLLGWTVQHFPQLAAAWCVAVVGIVIMAGAVK